MYNTIYSFAIIINFTPQGVVLSIYQHKNGDISIWLSHISIIDPLKSLKDWLYASNCLARPTSITTTAFLLAMST